MNLYNTPSITPEDTLGVSGAVGALTIGMNSSDPQVQVVSIITIGLISIALTIAGSYRRGKRAEHLPRTDLTDEIV